MANLRTSHMMAGGGDGVGPDEGPYVLDTRFSVRRVINGIPVANSGLEVTINNDLEVTRVAFRWRTIASSDLPIAASHTWDEALQALRSHLGDYYQFATIDQQEIAYIDTGRGKSQGVYEPWYVVVYRVRTPIATDPGKFVASKREAFQFPMLSAVQENAVLAAHGGPAITP